MPAMSGTNGKVMQGANVVLNMTEWTIDLKGASVDTSAFGGSGWGAFTGTIKTWTAKCSGNYDPADTTGQVALNNGLASSFSMKFYTDATHYWAGDAALVGVGLKSSAAGVITTEYSFNGATSVTYT